MAWTFKLWGTFVALVALVVGQTWFARTVATTASDDIAIYQMLVAKLQPQAGKQLAVSLTTVPNPLTNNAEILARVRRCAPESVIDDFAGRNCIPIAIPHFAAVVPLVYVSRERPDQMHKVDFWKDFHRSFPDASGTIEFSRPGFSQDRTTALVNYCYYLHSEYGFYVMSGTLYCVKSAGHWTINRPVMVIKS